MLYANLILGNYRARCMCVETFANYVKVFGERNCYLSGLLQELPELFAVVFVDATNSKRNSEAHREFNSYRHYIQIYQLLHESLYRS